MKSYKGSLPNSNTKNTSLVTINNLKEIVKTWTFPLISYASKSPRFQPYQLWRECKGDVFLSTRGVKFPLYLFRCHINSGLVLHRIVSEPS